MSAFDLVAQTAAQAKAAQAAAAAAAKQAAMYAAAPSPDSFALTGSDRAADSIPGQADIFGAGA